MIENTFVVVGTILRIDRIPAGLLVVVGGRGPVKVSAAFEVHHADLVALMTDQKAQFMAGDMISAGGSLRFDEASGRVIAVADRTRVVLVARAAASNATAAVARPPDAPPARANTSVSAPPQPRPAAAIPQRQPAQVPVTSTGMFGGTPNPVAGPAVAAGPAAPAPLPEGFPPPGEFPDIQF